MYLKKIFRTLSYRCGSCSNLNSGALVLYDPMQQTVVPPQQQYLPQNYWYPIFPPPPPPFYFGNGIGSPPLPPHDLESFRKAIKVFAIIISNKHLLFS